MNSSPPTPGLQLLNRVPEVTLYFWIIKIMATTVGETAADFLSVKLHLGLSGTSVAMGALLAITLSLHIRARQYVPWLYWGTVVLMSIVGTLITDNLVDNLGISLEVATTAFGLALLATFVAWYSSEGTLSIRTVYTRKREIFYWATVLFTFALGTAAGDLMAEGLRLGYATSGLIFAAMIAAVALAHYVFRLNAIVAFWLAYILTRPLGASFGDYLSQPQAAGGLGLGTATTSMIFLSIILSLVSYLAVSRKDVSDPARKLPGQAP